MIAIKVSKGTAYPSGTLEFNPGFQWGVCYSICWFMCMFCKSLFVLLYFFFGHSVVFPSSIYGFWLPLVSSNSSYLVMETNAIKQFFTWISHQDFLVRQDLLVLKLKSSLGRSTVAIMIWLTVTVYLCQRWPQICSICHSQFQSLPCLSPDL